LPGSPLSEYFHGDTGAGLGASHQTGWIAGHALLQQGGAITGPRPTTRSTAAHKVIA
jgi:hypothetical protein